MEVLTVQNQYAEHQYTDIAPTRMKTWSRSMSQTSTRSNTQNELNSTTGRKQFQHQQQQQQHLRPPHARYQLQHSRSLPPAHAAAEIPYLVFDEQHLFNNDCDNTIDAMAVNELSMRLLTELRAAKTHNLTCTEVSLPSDLTQRIATDIVRVSEREPCGIRGCTIYVEYEEELNNCKRIAKLKLDDDVVSTFEVYLTLRQDKHRWSALLPQFIKGLSRTITISPDYTINKRKLYSHDSN